MGVENKCTDILLNNSLILYYYLFSSIIQEPIKSQNFPKSQNGKLVDTPNVNRSHHSPSPKRQQPAHINPHKLNPLEKISVRSCPFLSVPEKNYPR